MTDPAVQAAFEDARMLALLLAATLSGPPHGCPIPAVDPYWLAGIPGDDKPLKALDAWLKHYRTGKMDYRSKENIAKDSIAMKFGIMPKNGLGHPTWAGDLATILEAVVKLDTAEAARAALEVAAVGVDQGKYQISMAPHDVRTEGEFWIAKFTSAAAKDELAKAARGEARGEKSQVVAMQIAGVRCLGLLKDRAYRQVLELALGAHDDMVRVSAAEALGALDDEASALPLIATIERDTVDAVLVSASQALRSLYSKYLPKGSQVAPPPAEPSTGGADKKDKEGGEPAAGKPADPNAPAAPAPAAPPAAAPTPAAEPPESLRLAVKASIMALGRTTWRADMALIRLLDDFRSIETVPALIGVLERFKAHPEEVKSGKLSGLLLYQAHELLVAMTGALYPADQPEKWRAFWEAEKDKIEVAKKREPTPGRAVMTAAAGFCGIPVQGTRVVFVLDLSGSMKWQMDDVGADGKKTHAIRLDFAKRELLRATDALAPNAQFGLVTFSRDCTTWKKDLVAATEKNREAFKKYVSGLEADGGTNLWSGLEEALKIRSLVYGNRYMSNVDEVFVLSDGAPSVGDITDPIEILRLVQECNKFSKVRINTFFISSAATAEQRQSEPRMSITPQDLMRRMAEQNGGKFKEL